MEIIEKSLAVVEGAATAFWVGASAGFAFISAPATAHEANDLDLQAKITGASLERLASASIVAGGVSIACALLRSALDRKHVLNDLARAGAGCVAISLIAYHQDVIVPEMTELQHAMGGSFKSVPEEDPKRVAYREVHQESTSIFGGALLAGVAQIGLAAIR